MTDNKKFFVDTIKDESARFERVFKALPHDKLDYRPSEKSKTAMELASSMAMEFLALPIFLKEGNMDFAKLSAQPEIKTIEDAWVNMKRGIDEAAEVATSMSQEDWDSKAAMVSGEKVEWETSRGAMVWAFLLDLVHHRGQLSVYIRPMGGKVPSIYGPSADSAE